MPTTLDDWLTEVWNVDRVEEAGDRLEDESDPHERVLERLAHREAHPVLSDADAQRAPPVSFLPRVTVLVMLGAVPVDRDDDNVAGPLLAERGEECLPVRKRGVVELLDRVSRLDAGRGGCAVGQRHVDRQSLPSVRRTA